MPQKIKLMTDYYCYPLWEVGPESHGDIDPETLPLKPQTIQRLQAWADKFNSILNEEDPASSGFDSEADRQAFDREGISLWHQVISELEPEYEVHYFSQCLGKHFSTPRELELEQALIFA
jgi:hypothetical protein